ncbi:MAG: hypothetical protein Q8P80_04510 [Candidatus Levybacteria bacterium]|nr:hypothetical protein [Candidatus Levybacteria bacterium]
MTATGHAILGTVIAAKIGNPALAVPIAIASHLVMDFVPHWDTATNARKKSRKRLISDSFIDVSLGFLISLLLLKFLFPQTNVLYAFLIIFSSQAFDWFMAPYYFFRWKIFKWAYTFQKKFDRELDKPWGIITQTGVVLFVIIIAIII